MSNPNVQTHQTYEESQRSNQTLPKYDIEVIADTMRLLFEDSKEQSLMLQWFHIQKLLLAGQPVSPERIAATLQISRNEVTAILNYWGAALDNEGNVVGLGLSVVPTPHAYQINGRQLYVWCAGDAIMFPIFHKASAVIESPDPISGEKVRLIGTPEGAKEVEPSTAVVSWVPGTLDIEKVRAKFCNFTNFFTSVETASQYVARHPDLIIVPIDAVFQLGKLFREREPYKSVIAGL
jgi:alkylmercury lyase